MPGWARSAHGWTGAAGSGGPAPSALTDAAEPPAKGSKVVIDATGTGPDAGQPLPGLIRAATLLNLAAAGGLKASDLEVVVVLHGDATSAALNDAAYKASGRYRYEANFGASHWAPVLAIPWLARDLRDWLRVSTEDRTRYETVKRHLAQEHWDDMNDYADAKTDVVLDILTRARTWRTTNARPLGT